MIRQFWLERWYNDQIGFHQREINTALQAHWGKLGVPADGAVFVPLCGKSRDMLWLRAQGYAVLGVEFVQMAVRDFFAENDLTPFVSAQPPFERWEAKGVVLLCGDFFDLNAEDLKRVSAVYDRAALIALPRDMRQQYVDKMYEILPPAAEMFLISLSYPQHEMAGPPFSVSEEEVRVLYRERYEVESLAREEALENNGHLRERGLTQLTEQVYRIRRLDVETE